MLSTPQNKLLVAVRNARPITHSDGSITEASLLVSGHEYRAALALERRGLVSVRYQGPSMGWVSPR